jgi:hypothetical protein
MYLSIIAHSIGSWQLYCSGQHQQLAEQIPMATSGSCHVHCSIFIYNDLCMIRPYKDNLF